MYFPLQHLPRRKKSGPKAAMTPERFQQLRELSSPERNQSDIARALGVAPSTVSKHQRALGLPRPPRGVRCGSSDFSAKICANVARPPSYGDD